MDQGELQVSFSSVLVFTTSLVWQGYGKGTAMHASRTSISQSCVAISKQLVCVELHINYIVLDSCG